MEIKKNKPDYKNWMPKHYLVVLAIFTALFLGLTILFGPLCFFLKRWLRVFLSILFCLIFLLFLVFLIIGCIWYKTFSYDGKRQFAKEIIDRLSQYCDLPDGGKALDVGCGSGALTIATAKRNPKAMVTGIDFWGIEYIDITKQLCEDNARAEGVDNTEFIRGSIKKLKYPDEYFDHVTSNYCYSNMIDFDKQSLLLESLRVLKKGGTFAIHDVMNWVNFGDMNKFVDKLKEMGFEDVKLIDTSKGLFMSEQEAWFLSLKGSMLLYGKK